MDKDEMERSERRPNARCWSGPILVVETRGSVFDLCQWIKITLSHHYNKATTLGFMSLLEFSHVHEEHVIMAFAIGREPHATAIREVYARMKVDHNGVLKSNCSTYCFSILGHGEQARCDVLVEHYDWVARVSDRLRVMNGTKE